MQKETTRKCIVTGEVFEKDQLLRFTVLPDNTIVPDFKKKLPGRGVYVSNAKSLLEKAIKKGIFARSLKSGAKSGMFLAEQVEGLLKKQALDAVSLARKAGVLVVGADQVKEALKKGKVAFLHEALDAAWDGHGKIVSLAKGVEIFSLFKIEELDKELAKDNMVHLAFVKGNMADAVRQSFERLASFLNN